MANNKITAHLVNSIRNINLLGRLLLRIRTYDKTLKLLGEHHQIILILNQIFLNKGTQSCFRKKKDLLILTERASKVGILP